MTSPASAALLARRAALARQVEAMSRDLAAVVEASVDSNADDEHDPEGATIAFERQQLAALLDATRRQLDEADRAVAAVDAGRYGRCEACGGPIGNARLEARPAARTCITCATPPRRPIARSTG